MSLCCALGSYTPNSVQSFKGHLGFFMRHAFRGQILTPRKIFYTPGIDEYVTSHGTLSLQ